MLNHIGNYDTICALATPHGMGAIAVIRISGAQAFPIVATLFQSQGKPLEIIGIHPNKAYHGYLINNDELLDEAVVTFFKAPHSFTGEDTAYTVLYMCNRNCYKSSLHTAVVWPKPESLPDEPLSTGNST